MQFYREFHRLGRLNQDLTPIIDRILIACKKYFITHVSEFGIFILGSANTLWTNIGCFITISGIEVQSIDLNHTTLPVSSNSTPQPLNSTPQPLVIEIPRVMDKVALPKRFPSQNLLRQFCGQCEVFWIKFFNRDALEKSLITIIKKHFSPIPNSILNIIGISTASDMEMKWLAMTALVFGEIQTRMPRPGSFLNPDEYKPTENYSAMLYLFFCAKLARIPAPPNLSVWKKAYQYYNITESFGRYVEGNLALKYKSAYYVGNALDSFINSNWEIPLSTVRNTINGGNDRNDE